jgi:anti-sigma B factor antagonist
VKQPSCTSRNVVVDSHIASAAHGGCVVSEKWTGPTVVISVVGVLDMLTAPQLKEVIAASLPKNPSTIIIDLSEVDFLASAGMGVLVEARERADGTMRFGVVADGPATSRPLKLVGLADMIGLHPTLDEARSALSA